MAAGLDPPKSAILKKRVSGSMSPSRNPPQFQDFVIQTPRHQRLQKIENPHFATLSAENQLSPWRIRVTVQAEPDEQENQLRNGAQAGRSPSKPRSRSPKKARISPARIVEKPLETNRTTIVPLRGLSPSPSAPARSPKKVRKMPKKPRAKPVNGRKATPRPRSSDNAGFDSHGSDPMEELIRTRSPSASLKAAQGSNNSKESRVGSTLQPSSSALKPNLTRSSLGLFSRSPNLRSTRPFRSRRSEEDTQRRTQEASFIDPSTFLGSESSPMRKPASRDTRRSEKNDQADHAPERGPIAGRSSPLIDLLGDNMSSPMDDIDGQINASEDFTMISVSSLPTAANISRMDMDDDVGSEIGEDHQMEAQIQGKTPSHGSTPHDAMHSSHIARSKLPTPDSSSSSIAGEPPDITMFDSPEFINQYPAKRRSSDIRPKTPLESAPEPQSNPPPLRESPVPHLPPQTSQLKPRLGPSPLARVVRAGSALHEAIISPSNSKNDLSSPFQSPVHRSSKSPPQGFSPEDADPFLLSTAPSYRISRTSLSPNRRAAFVDGAGAPKTAPEHELHRHQRPSFADSQNSRTKSASRKRAVANSPSPKAAIKRRSIQYPDLLPPPDYRLSLRSQTTAFSTTPDGPPPALDGDHSSSFWIRQAKQQSKEDTPSAPRDSMMKSSSRSRPEQSKDESSVHTMGDTSLQAAVAYFQEQGEKRRSQAKASRSAIHEHEQRGSSSLQHDRVRGPRTRRCTI